MSLKVFISSSLTTYVEQYCRFPAAYDVNALNSPRVGIKFFAVCLSCV